MIQTGFNVNLITKSNIHVELLGIITEPEAEHIFMWKNIARSIGGTGT